MEEEFFRLLPKSNTIENARKIAYKTIKIINWQYGFFSKRYWDKK